MFPLPWSCSETMSTPCFARMNSALWEGSVQAFPAGVGVPEAMPGRCGQGAASHTTSWHGSGALVEQSWAAGLSQAQIPPPLHSSWVSGTGLPPPHASSPARSSQYRHGPRVLPGVPTGPVLVGARATAPAQGIPHLLEVHRRPVHLCPVSHPQRIQDAGEVGCFYIDPAQTREGGSCVGWSKAGLLVAEEAERRRAGQVGEGGHLVTPLRTAVEGRGKRTEAFHWPHAKLTSPQATPATPCCAMAVPAVPWSFQLCHGHASRAKCATASPPGLDNCTVCVPANAQAAAGQGCVPVPRSLTEEAIQRGQPLAQPQGGHPRHSHSAPSSDTSPGTSSCTPGHVPQPTSELKPPLCQ